jgi:hypothetical protein
MKALAATLITLLFSYNLALSAPIDSTNVDSMPIPQKITKEIKQRGYLPKPSNIQWSLINETINSIHFKYKVCFNLAESIYFEDIYDSNGTSVYHFSQDNNRKIHKPSINVFKSFNTLYPGVKDASWQDNPYNAFGWQVKTWEYHPERFEVRFLESDSDKGVFADFDSIGIWQETQITYKDSLLPPIIKLYLHKHYANYKNTSHERITEMIDSKKEHFYSFSLYKANHNDGYIFWFNSNGKLIHRKRTHLIACDRFL